MTLEKLKQEAMMDEATASAELAMKPDERVEATVCELFEVATEHFSPYVATNREFKSASREILKSFLTTLTHSIEKKHVEAIEAEFNGFNSYEYVSDKCAEEAHQAVEAFKEYAIKAITSTNELK